MKISIEVKSRREAEAMRRGLDDSAVRAFVLVMGVLLALPTKRAQRRVLEYVADRIEEENGIEDARGDVDRQIA
jgi:hypothetical protein